MTETHEVKPGQIWADNDCRVRLVNGAPFRLIKVLVVEQATSPIGKGGYAAVTSSFDGGKHWYRKSRIRLNRFKPTANGYKLYQEAP